MQRYGMKNKTSLIETEKKQTNAKLRHKMNLHEILYKLQIPSQLIIIVGYCITLIDQADYGCDT